MSASLLASYRRALERELKAGRATEPSHYPTLKDLVESLAPGIHVTSNPKRIEAGAPDFVVSRRMAHGPLTIGYMEAKDLGADLDDAERSKQLTRYRASLANLVLTDFLEFRWYVDGAQRLAVSLGKRVKGNKILWSEEAAEGVRRLLDAFLEHKVESISRPKELAERLARLTHMIRDLILGAFEIGAASAGLQDLRQAFEKALIPDLTDQDFADMYAQTIAYGLFAARANHQGEQPFRRVGAAAEIPKTNPLLRRLFTVITGPDLEEEPYAGFVDDLAQLLADTNMDAVLSDFGKRTRREDPVVHFYETFLAAYDPDLRETRGVYYTPEPVVSYIVRSVDRVLKTIFGIEAGLVDASRVEYNRGAAGAGEIQERASAHRVLILDPACGTGTFLYEVVDGIRSEFIAEGNAGMWSGYVRDHLLPRMFGFELLMAPYAVAHLKLGLQLAGQDLPAGLRGRWSYDFSGDERLRVYLTNTLEEAERRAQIEFSFLKILSEEANEAVRIKSELPIMVVLGNPPYSGHSANRSWELKEGKRVPNFIGRLLEDYRQVDGRPLEERNPKWLQDDYVKFIRFGQWRIDQTGAGILAFITNHGYIDNPTFRGMRESLMKTFNKIYLLDLHGNTKKKEVAPGGVKDVNVFDIQQGVAIGIFIKDRGEPAPGSVYHADLWGSRDYKYQQLHELDVSSTAWQLLRPSSPLYLFAPQDTALQAEYQMGIRISDLMPVGSAGIVTARDHLAVHFTENELLRTLREFASLSPEDARAKYGLGPDVQDWRVKWAQDDVKKHGTSSKRVARLLYRPFDYRYTYYSGHSRGFVCRPRPEVMSHLRAGKNLALIGTRQTRDKWAVLVSREVFAHKCCAAYDINSGFPLYLYPAPDLEKGDQTALPRRSPWPAGVQGRTPNLAPNLVGKIETRLGMAFKTDGHGDLVRNFGPDDLLSYMYAIFHSPTYRERYAKFLASDFPYLPVTSDRTLFHSLCEKGGELVALHLTERIASEKPRFPEKGTNRVEKIVYTAPGKDGVKGRVWINSTQQFDDIVPDIWEYRFGGYQVCEKWLKDRKGRKLSHDDLAHYQAIVANLTATRRLMTAIDSIIPGWPLK